MSKKVKRLVSQFKPSNYNLNIQIDRENLSFKGTVTISGSKLGRPSHRLSFHQKELRIISAKIIHRTKSGDTQFSVDRINRHKTHYEVRLHTNESMPSGQYTVTMEFEGRIAKTMLGIYACDFKYDGKDKLLIATQFESHHAREAFPCIDEPEAKATFDLSISTPWDETVLSNTFAKSKSKNGKLYTTTFETTPIMSPYLLAFVTGEMHSVEDKTKSGTPVRSWSSIAIPKKMLSYSVDEAVKILEFFEKYFGVRYPLKKYDQVALPDFDAGAMENWGMSTFREIALLADPDNRSISNEQYVSLVIAHELSHQWFGNLVTMKWWDDIWLNESFAALMEHLPLSIIHPEWNQWELYTASDVVVTTMRDVYADIQPIVVDVTDPDLIETLFDPSIVYAKGARLLKMLREYIGDDAFAKGLNNYFKKHAYQNTSREDLWSALSETSGKDISELMTPWLVQPGLPVVHATQQGDTLRVEQKRFLLDENTNHSLWPIPLLANTMTTPDVAAERNESIKLESKLPVLINKYGSGHFITHYADSLHHAALAQELSNGKLAAESRINIFNDMLLLARHGDISLTEPLYLAANCKQESRDSVWGLIARCIGSAVHLTEGDETSDKLIKKLKVEMARDWHNKLGWEDAPDDDPNTKQLRHTMISLMVSGEDKMTIETALGHYKHAKSPGDLPAETRATILGVAVRHGDKSVVDHLLRTYPDGTPDTQLDITLALAHTKSNNIAKHVLSKALGEGGLARPQDIIRWLAVFLRNYYTREAAWDFVSERWDWIESVMGGSKNFDYLPTIMASIVNTDEWSKRYHDLYVPKSHIKALKHNIHLGLAEIKSRVAWRKRDEQAIREWLAANVKAQ